MLAALKIAQSSLGAETVLYMNRFTRRTFTLDEQPGADKELNIYVPLYAAPPACIPVMYKGTKLLTKEGLELIRDGVAEATGLEAMCMAEALLSTQPAADVQDNWTSCSDAVPADFGDVILHDALGNVFPGSWDKVYCSIRGGNKMAFVDNDGIEVENVTHWMPLPEPPQEANQ
uniref:DUF551 domain-containing protein n=1 Tax=Citrobacter braakii TaxID=57706 RepID=UPI00396AF37E